MNDADDPRTTTILTFEVPPILGFRLRNAMQKLGHNKLDDIAVEALENWLAKHEERRE